MLQTDKKQSSRSRIVKIVLNLIPAFRRSGGRICFISSDWLEVQTRLKLSWRTRNWVGTTFGGSIYSSTDPVYMTQFIQILGKDYVVWDKAASVNFKKPIRKTVYARFLLTQEFIDEVKAEVAQNGKHVFDLPVHYQDKDGTVYAEISKTLYVASKDYYNKKP
tara:strand:+ start:63665 stop:64153 length:489 start_codon:yes stop_codon:yes gene_type:complete